MALGDYGTRFSEYEARISQEIREKFENMMNLFDNFQKESTPQNVRGIP